MAERRRNRRGTGAHLREELLSAAARLVAEHGSERALSVRAITREAGSSPQSFYLQFEGLDDLVWAMFRDRFGEFEQAIAAAVDGETAPRPRLRAACTAYLAYAREHPGEYRLLFEPDGVQRDWGADLPGAPLLSLMRQLLADDGVPPDQLDVRLASLWSHLHGYAALRRSRRSYPWPDEAAMLTAILDPTPQ